MPYITNSYWLTNEMLPPAEKSIGLCVDFPESSRPLGVDLFVLVVCEPEAISRLRSRVIENRDRYDMILTHDEEIIKACPNARLCVYGTTWIPKEVYENIDVASKHRKISNITGWKEMTPAHVYRKQLYMNQLRIPLPITWFRSSKGALLPPIQTNPVVYDDKNVLFSEFQFSLVIENCRQANYFTEKLMDCLLTKTIPIYYGCSNIGRYFDTQGWIILETTNPDELVQKAAVLPDYTQHLETIESNHETAKKYVDYPSTIYRLINEGIGTGGAL